MPVLSISLLGSLQVTCDGQSLTGFDSDKTRALLAYLAVESDRPHRRESLAGLLWPERPERQARRSLTQALSNLRAVIGDRTTAAAHGIAVQQAQAASFLDVTHHEIQFRAGGNCWLDVKALADLTHAVQAHDHIRPATCDRCMTRLEQALDLYHGHFMEGFSLRDSPGFEEWASIQRERLGRLIAEVLQTLADCYEQRGELDQALFCAHRQVELAPWEEHAHRQLMRLYALDGQRGAALAQYDACCSVLRQELDVEPETETAQLYQRIRDGEIAPQEDRENRRHHLPFPLTPLVGRESALSEIARCLEDPACRLLTLVGPGGIGKTRLAIEIAAQQSERFQHGVHFCPLAPVQSVDGVVPAIVQALGFSSYAGAGGTSRTPDAARQQLLDYLRRKNLLLILDNMEHLGERADLLVAILETAPDVQILVTSRVRLKVPGEHVYTLGGMVYPQQVVDSIDDVTAYSAVELFLVSARRVAPDLTLCEANLPHVIQICRLVEGVPLGILLAAAWVEMLSPAEIATEIASHAPGGGIDFLEADWRGVRAQDALWGERHRSMRAVFDHSWAMLGERERQVFAGLAVFCGGCTRQAAQEVTGASLRELMALVDKSLLQRVPFSPAVLGDVTSKPVLQHSGEEKGLSSPMSRTGERYQVHELLRQYGAEKLAGSGDGCRAVYDRHCAYYVWALQQWAADLYGPRQQTAVRQMEMDIENVRAAWNWAARHKQIARLDRVTDTLGAFYQRCGRYREGEAAMSEAARLLQATAADGGSSPAGPETDRVLARILAWQGDFCLGLGQAERARQLLCQSETLLAQPGVAGQDIRREKALLLLIRGLVAYDDSYAQAGRLWAQSVALYRELGDLAPAAHVLCLVGYAAMFLGDPDAPKYYQESLEIRRALGDRMGITESLTGLGHTLTFYQPERAETLRRECLAICRETADPYTIAQGLHYLGSTLTYAGKFAEAHSYYSQSMDIYDNLGARRLIADVDTSLGFIEVHLGQYEQARARIERGLDLARETGYSMVIGLSLGALGHATLALGAHAEAERMLQEAVDLYRMVGQREWLLWALAWLGHAAFAQGKRAQARQHLYNALQTGGAPVSVILSTAGLSLMALLLADQGEPVRAVELYALALCTPYAAHSRFFEDVVGKHVGAAAAALLPDIVAAAQERGCARGLEETVEELLVELERQQSPDTRQGCPL